MFETILVPLDGSQLADCVLPHVVAIARSFDSEVTLLRVLEKSQTGNSSQLFDLLNWLINRTKALIQYLILNSVQQISQSLTQILSATIAPHV